MRREEGLDFSRVTTFNLDEYLGTVVLDEAAASKLALADHYQHVERLKVQYHIR